MKVLTKKQQEAKDLYDSGMNATQIADLLGVTQGSISQRLKRAGVKTNSGLSLNERVERYIDTTVDGVWLWNGPTTRGGIYPALFIKEKNMPVYVHRIVFELYNGEIQDGCQIHHIDENKFNCHPDNLIAMTSSEHSSLHKAGN